MDIREAFEHLDNMLSVGVGSDEEVEAVKTLRKALSGSENTTTNRRNAIARKGGKMELTTRQRDNLLDAILDIYVEEGLRCISKKEKAEIIKKADRAITSALDKVMKKKHV